MGAKYDFTGWATRNDLKCTDGRTIRRDAFKACDGQTVPIVWSHIHDDPDMVLGHAVLENRPEGVYMYGKFNDSPKGRQTKLLIEHGDVVGLSIWANQLKQTGGDVMHGVIREVSIVLAGANPGAFIDNAILAHADGTEPDDEAIIYTGEPIELMHSDEEEEDPKGDSKMADKKNPDANNDEETVEDVFNSLTDKQKNVVYALIGQALKDAGVEDDKDDDEEEEEEDDKEIKHADKDEETIEDVFNTLTDKQKDAVYALIGEALGADDEDDEDDDEEEDSEEEEEDVKHNVFDSYENNGDFLSHEDMNTIFADAKRLGSLREAVEAHIEDGVLSHAVTDRKGNTITYGMADVDYLFPEDRLVNNTPEFIKRNDGWVREVINGTHHTPFSRIKSVFANITMDEARAKGYLKGKPKKEEVFSLLKRSTDPQTIYKKQKMDRDDIIDITDFDVVAWLKAEMRGLLDEEIARAILIGDGRLTSDDDHIKEDHVHSIANDAALYNIKAAVETGATVDVTAKNMIKAAIRARKDYKGSGNPVMFISETWLTEMMLLEDQLGHPLFADEAALARRMRVSRIIPCPVMENQKIDGQDLYGIIVNLQDYNIGADKGGEVNMFEDFDIDYNQQKYLIETRISGALIRPYSAITLIAGTENDEP